MINIAEEIYSDYMSMLSKDKTGSEEDRELRAIPAFIATLEKRMVSARRKLVDNASNGEDAENGPALSTASIVIRSAILEPKKRGAAANRRTVLARRRGRISLGSKSSRSSSRDIGSQSSSVSGAAAGGTDVISEQAESPNFGGRVDKEIYGTVNDAHTQERLGDQSIGMGASGAPNDQIAPSNSDKDAVYDVKRTRFLVSGILVLRVATFCDKALRAYLADDVEANLITKAIDNFTFSLVERLLRAIPVFVKHLIEALAVSNISPFSQLLTSEAHNVKLSRTSRNIRDKLLARKAVGNAESDTGIKYEASRCERGSTPNEGFDRKLGVESSCDRPPELEAYVEDGHHNHTAL